MKIMTFTLPNHLLRSQATEMKFFLPMELALEVRDWARQSMPADPHIKTGGDDRYRVTSLYFDTARWDVFHKRGSYGRSKYRIRSYGAESIAFLERKIKTCGQISKWRTPVAHRELSCLTSLSHETWQGEWFHRRVRLRQLQLVCRIRYRRFAREAQGRFGKFRLTLDDSIYAETVKVPSFAEHAGGICTVDCCPEGMILELKFDEIMPVLFKQLIEDFRLSEGSFSKYRSSVEKLGLSAHLLSSYA